MRLPKILVHASLIVAFVAGHLLVWNDKRLDKSVKLSAKQLGGEKLA